MVWNFFTFIPENNMCVFVCVCVLANWYKLNIAIINFLAPMPLSEVYLPLRSTAYLLLAHKKFLSIDWEIGRLFVMTHCVLQFELYKNWKKLLNCNKNLVVDLSKFFQVSWKLFIIRSNKLRICQPLRNTYNIYKSF